MANRMKISIINGYAYKPYSIKLGTHHLTDHCGRVEEEAITKLREEVCVEMYGEYSRKRKNILCY